MVDPILFARINACERNLIIHSVIYYRFNTNLWSDTKWDSVAKELVSYKQTEEFKQSQFYDKFIDFEGETGFHLLDISPNYFTAKAEQLIKYCEEEATK